MITQKQIEESKVIWEPGQLHCHDFVIDGKTSVYKIPVDEYLKDHPECILLSNDEFKIELEKLENDTLLGDWVEITKDRYYEMLEVLPPEKWQNGCFRMCEYMTSNITNHFIQINQRFFEANRRTSDNYTGMIEEIKLQLSM